MKKIGCTTPFQEDKSHICTNESLGKKALEIYEEVYQNPKKGVYNPKCMYPCKFLSNFGTVTLSSFMNQHTMTRKVFYFSQHNQSFKSVHTYKALDLFAALGGYIGVFLGVSLLHLKNLISYVLDKVLHN